MPVNKGHAKYMQECVDLAKKTVDAKDVGIVAVALFEAQGDKNDAIASFLQDIAGALSNGGTPADLLAKAVERIAEKNEECDIVGNSPSWRLADAVERIAHSYENGLA